jgi:hypothetical protein
MAKTFLLQRGLDEFHLCRRLEDCSGAGPGAPTPIKYYEQVSAAVFVRSCVRDPELERKLRLWLDADPLQEKADANLIEDVANRIVAGSLIIAILKGEGDPDGKGILRTSAGKSSTPAKLRNLAAERTPLADEWARRAAAKSEDLIVLGEPEPEPETTWIEIELIDADGAPAVNERYKLTLPDGSTHWGRLDSKGRARVERLQPGNCQVTFPDRDEQVWDVG